MSLTSLAAVKAFKNQETDEHDAELLRLIAVAERFIAAYCRRTIEQATVTDYLSPVPGQLRLFLARPPVASITGLYDDPLRVYGADTLVPATEYVIQDGPAGIVAVDGHRLAGGIHSVKIVYLGGFTPVPPDVEQAAIELTWLTRDLGDKALLGVSGKQIADGSITMFQRGRLEAVRELLEPYRLRRI